MLLIIQREYYPLNKKTGSTIFSKQIPRFPTSEKSFLTIKPQRTFLLIWSMTNHTFFFKDQVSRLVGIGVQVN